MSNTINQYDSIIENCRDIFVKKMKDYGTSWRILRLRSITDQVFIKANRIRTLQETGVSKVGKEYCQSLLQWLIIQLWRKCKWNWEQLNPKMLKWNQNKPN